MIVKFTTAKGSVYGNLCTLDHYFEINKGVVRENAVQSVHIARTLIYSEPFWLFALILGDRKTVPKNDLADALDESPVRLGEMK